MKLNLSPEQIWEIEQELAWRLSQIETYDLNYPVRKSFVLMAMGLAAKLGYRVELAYDFDKPKGSVFDGNRIVVYIFLPTEDGKTEQVSWHMHECEDETYDGHTTEEKYQRVRRYIESKVRGSE